jgi:hypothetical protein
MVRKGDRISTCSGSRQAASEFEGSQPCRRVSNSRQFLKADVPEAAHRNDDAHGDEHDEADGVGRFLGGLIGVAQGIQHATVMTILGLRRVQPAEQEDDDQEQGDDDALGKARVRSAVRA